MDLEAIGDGDSRGPDGEQHVGLNACRGSVSRTGVGVVYETDPLMLEAGVGAT